MSAAMQHALDLADEAKDRQLAADNQARYDLARIEAARLIAIHCVEYRQEFEDRLWAMTPEQLVAYVDIRVPADNRWWQERISRTPWHPEPDLTLPPPRPEGYAPEHDRDEAPGGLDPRLHPWAGEVA